MQLIKAAKELLILEPFYGFFLLGLRKEIVDNDHPIKTAAVGPNGVSFTLYVNNVFWNTLSDDEQISVLKHELLHLCFFHLTENFKAENHYNMNIASDCSVNQYISGLPAGCVTLESLSRTLGKKLEPKRGAWYYYKEIQDFIKKHPEKCKPAPGTNGEGGLDGFDELDDHTLWPQEASEAERKLYENHIKSKLKEAVETTIKQAGNIPGELSEILKKIKDKPPVFNWRKYFRRLVGNSITSEILLTRMRPNKRFPDAKGMKLKRKPNILVGVDTSGSISTNNLQDFFSEIHHIYKTGVNITVAECDTQIQNIFEYNGKQDIKISGRGGTLLEPIITYYKQHKEFTSCVLFTDGYCNTNMPPCKNLIWVITSNGNKSQKYTPGYVILIP